MSVFFLSAYFSCLVVFSFITHPLFYCLLLLTSAFSVAGLIYSVLGVAWYILLFCLVYVGGVYILFIFVSLHSPNPNSLGGGSNSMVFLVFVVSFFVFWFCGLNEGMIKNESYYLCSGVEGITYCFFCLILLMGFICVSVVVGEKDSFFR